MPEKVRLVIWDLDETFWHGTITEGGVSDYVQAHHEIVIELARRGIVSSICSKNEEAATLAYLAEKGIRDYFVFPSISWHPKGPRLAALVEAVQLRPETIMFIDDNPGNRGEAAEFVPGLQIEDETFIDGMLDDPRFAGKDDPGLTRLGQYRLLEMKKLDEQHTGGDNIAFLRGCDVRVYIEYDILNHIDRAIELINRTNQLNYTKRRLSDNLEEARTQLRLQLGSFRTSSGLVRAFDKYGDYGFVGFYLLNGDPPVACHYCFSCRTLGMMIEKWLYDRLGQPRLKVIGEVITDIFQPQAIDWIRLVTSPSATAPAISSIAPEIRILGGCEANPLAHYLRAYSPDVKVTSTTNAGGLSISLNATPLLLSACDRHGPEFKADAEAMGLPYEFMVSDFLSDAPPGTVFILAGGSDGYSRIRYRHKEHGWEIRVDPEGTQRLNIFAHSEATLTERLDAAVSPGRKREQVEQFVQHIRQNYKPVPGDHPESITQHTDALLRRIPRGSKMILILDSHRIRVRQTELHVWESRRTYNKQISSQLETCAFAAAINFDDCIASEDEILPGGNHFDRKVYYRMSEAIVATLAGLTPKWGGPHATNDSHGDQSYVGQTSEIAPVL